MRSINTILAIGAAALALAGTASAREVIYVVPGDPQPVVVRTDKLPAYIARELEAESAKGLAAVRQYVQRTKFMHQLDLIDVLMTPEQAQRVATAEPDARFVKVAQR
jgi:hypothetical protein